ncbi:jg7324 [Pararge aegeria aegeria]|uniref:Jg7324 protein n=1 Tax=Pararge aegeria aegeria TaxID=348720 RepID=A0A8S4RJL7_9NEOP|nr:jg7324 [Pararge aegeria aegeria]
MKGAPAKCTPLSINPRGVDVKAHVPVMTPTTTPCRADHSIAIILFSGRNKHGGITSSEQLWHKELYYYKMIE